jgi:hypothetical protein
MNSDLSKQLLAVCSVLSSCKVEYLIVGGTAVALHGYFRGSVNMWGTIADKPDLDVWYNSNYPNYFRLLNALEALGQDVREFKEEQTPNPKKSFFKFQSADITLDFLPAIKASISFRAAYTNKEVVFLDDVAIYFIGFEDLISDKEATARVKDISDIEQLRNKKDDNNT